LMIPVEEDAQTALRDFLKRLLQVELVDALLIPVADRGGSVTPALVTDPDLLDQAQPLAPVMGTNAARAAAWCTAPGYLSEVGSRRRVGALLRSCELRALVELAKLQQASLSSLLTIGVDCLSTYDVSAYAAMLANGGPGLADLFAGARDGDISPREGYRFREACEMCERPHIEAADITLELFGADLSAGIPVRLSEAVADEMADALKLSEADSNGARDAVIDALVAARTVVRDQRLAEIRARLDNETIEGVFAACVRCHNCMEVCPICYCKTCLFKSPTFDHGPAKLLSWADRKGLYRLPADRMLFHLTRLNHMALSCVGCGVCSSGCMAGLPVSLIFRAIGEQVQRSFGYVPGRDVDESLPMITFSEEEWEEVGEEYV